MGETHKACIDYVYVTLKSKEKGITLCLKETTGKLFLQQKEQFVNGVRKETYILIYFLKTSDFTEYQ